MQDKYDNLMIEISYGVLCISGTRNGKRFYVTRPYRRANCVVLKARHIWEATGMWPTVCLAEEVRGIWSAFLAKVNGMITTYKGSTAYKHKSAQMKLL